MRISLTAVYKKVPEGYVAFVEELPGANTQGYTLEEARENLEEAIQLVLESNKLLSEIPPKDFSFKELYNFEYVLA
ncbi:MAG: type II toxin-antitoxin system HicB family antitoxin [bacterium]